MVGEEIQLKPFWNLIVPTFINFKNLENMIRAWKLTWMELWNVLTEMNRAKPYLQKSIK